MTTTHAEAATPWLRRHTRRMMWLMMGLLIAPFAAAVIWFMVTGSARAFLLMTLMVFANVVNIINPIVFRRVKRRVLEHRGLICTACLFPLDGLASGGVCPECGTAYDFESTAEAWRRQLGIKQDQPLNES